MKSRLVPHGNLVEDWYDRYEMADFDKFIYLWISFNAWLAQWTQPFEDVKHDAQMIKWFSLNFKIHYLNFVKNNTNLRKDVKWFCKFGVYNMQRGTHHKPENIEDFDNLMKTIYTVRCNLFHGGKSSDTEIDQTIVKRATSVLVEIYRPLFEKYRQDKHSDQQILSATNQDNLEP